MMLNWGDPEDDGGSDVIGFIIERKEPKAHTWRQPIETPSSKCEIVGIMEGQEYIFRVVAKNKYGCGPPVDLGPIRAVDPLCKEIYLSALTHRVIYFNWYCQLFSKIQFGILFTFKLHHRPLRSSTILRGQSHPLALPGGHLVMMVAAQSLGTSLKRRDKMNRTLCLSIRISVQISS